MLNFKSWKDFDKKNKELNLKIYCKSHLKELRLKPSPGAIPQQHKVYTGGKWKVFNFYNLKDTEHIRKRATANIRELELTTENICKALYVVNKSAKKSRDSKQNNYFKSNYGIVARCKGRQNNLYDLKNKVMDKLLLEKKLSLKGYNIQYFQGEKVYLILYQFENYSFHSIAEEWETEDMTYLGNIEDIISAESKNIDIKFGEAINLLNKYLKI